MIEPGHDHPKHLLLATDLSAKVDRARDRAIALARTWDAQLTAVHALDLAQIPSDQQDGSTNDRELARALRAMHQELEEATDIRRNVVVGIAKPVELILDVVRERGCDLIVTGIAAYGPLGQSILGSTTSALARRAAVPVLVVKKRVRHSYRRVVVASDLSEASGEALDLSARLFAPSGLVLYHAFDMPFRGFVEDRREYASRHGASVREEARTFLSQHLGSNGAQIGVEVSLGEPSTEIARFAAEEDMDLVVAGTHGRSGVLGLVLGSTATAILRDVPCDVLVVPSKGARE